MEVTLLIDCITSPPCSSTGGYTKMVVDVMPLFVSLSQIIAVV